MSYPQHSSTPTPEQRQVWSWLTTQLSDSNTFDTSKPLNADRMAQQAIARFRLTNDDFNRRWVTEYVRKAHTWAVSQHTESLFVEVGTGGLTVSRFSPYGSKGGIYYARRASDSDVVRIKKGGAEAWANKPAFAEANAPSRVNEYLAVWWVPPEYKSEAEGRVLGGWIKPLWTWENGRLIYPGDQVVKGQATSTNRVEGLPRGDTVERSTMAAAAAAAGLSVRAARIAATVVPVILKAGKYACTPAGRVAVPAATAFALNRVCGGVEGLPLGQRNMRVDPALVHSLRTRIERCGCSSSHTKAVEYLTHLEQAIPAHNAGPYIERAMMSGRVLRQGELKADVAVLWRLMTEKVYGSGDLPALAARESLQNGVDAIRAAYRAYKRDPTDPNGLEPGTGLFEIDWNEDTGTLTFTDNGYGMSEHILEDKFFVLGASGKGEDEEAAGGFGAAKAVILGVSQTQEWEIWTRDRGAKALPGMGFNLLEMPLRQGTEITSRNVDASKVTSALFGNAWASVRKRLTWTLSLSNLPDIELRYNDKVVEPIFPGRRGSILRKYEDYDWGEKTTVRVKGYKRKIGAEGGGQFYIRLNGIFQFAVSSYAKLKSDVVIDVTTKYRPEAREYPFDASRSHFSSASDAYYAFRKLREEFERETESADWAPDWDTLLPDSTDEKERQGAALFADALKDVMDDPEIKSAMDDALGSIAEFVQEVEQREKIAQGVDVTAAGDTGIKGQAGSYEKWRDLSDIAKADATSTEGRVALGELVISIVGSADPDVGIPWDLQQAADRLRDGQTIDPENADAILTALAEVPDKLANDPDQVGTSGIPAAVAAADVAQQIAALAETDVDTVYADYSAAERKQVKNKIKKKASEVNPFGSAAMVKISRNNYDKKKSRKFLKNAAKYIPHLLVWDLALKLIAQEARITIPFRPGFVLDDTVRAVATSTGTAGVDQRSYILANPDELAATVKVHKDRPAAIAAWLHNVGLHELVHLPRMGRGHNEEFITEREAVAVQTGHLLPAIEQIVIKVFGLKPKPTARDKAMIREAKKQARLAQKTTLASLRSENKRLTEEHTRLTAIATGPDVTADLAKRIEALADYHGFREYLLGPGRAFLPSGVSAEDLIAALDENPQVAVGVIMGEDVPATVESLAVPPLGGAWVPPQTLAQKPAAPLQMPTDLGKQVFTVAERAAKQQEITKVMMTFLPYAKKIAAGLPFVFDAVAMYFALLDPKTPFWVKATVAGALTYVLSAIDLVPDFIPVAGWADDSAVVYSAIRAVRVHVLPRHWQQAGAWLRSERVPTPAASTAPVEPGYTPLPGQSKAGA